MHYIFCLVLNFGFEFTSSFGEKRQAKKMTDNVESSETTPRPWEFLETSECERLKWKNIKKLNLIRKDLKACKTDVFHDPRDDIKDKNLLNAVNSFLEDVGTDPHKISFSGEY